MCLFSRIFCTCYLLLYEFPGGPRKKTERKRCNCYLPQDLNSCRQPATTCEIFLSFRNNGTKHLSALGSTHHDLSASSQHPQSLVQPSFILNTAARTSNVLHMFYDPWSILRVYSKTVRHKTIVFRILADFWKPFMQLNFLRNKANRRI